MSKVRGRTGVKDARQSARTSARNAGTSGQAMDPTLGIQGMGSTAGWKPPTPKGMVPQFQSAEESARFTNHAAMPSDRARNRHVSDAALSAAKQRQALRAPIEQDDDESEPDLDVLGDGIDPNVDLTDDPEFDWAATDDPNAPENLQDAIERTERQLQQLRAQRQPKLDQRTTQQAVTQQVTGQRDIRQRAIQGQAQESFAPHLIVVPMSLEDTDRLWDWLRQDTKGDLAFFGREIRNSQDLHAMMQLLVNGESVNKAIGRSIYFIDANRVAHHIGLAALMPILSTERVALMHIYLSPETRGGLAQLVPALVGEARNLLPDFRLAVMSTDDTWRRLHRQVLGPLGFTEHTMFIL